jgi:hypothetical protein
MPVLPQKASGYPDAPGPSLISVKIKFATHPRRYTVTGKELFTAKMIVSDCYIWHYI